MAAEADAGTYRVATPVYGGTFRVAQEEPSTAGHVSELPFVLEGELVQLTESESSAPSLQTVRVLEPSAARVEPRCVHFGACGGCQYQHMAQPEQVRTKAQVLEALLLERRIALPAAGVRTHSAEPWHYRNRARLRIQAGTVGYSRRRSNAFLPVRECPIVSPLLWRTVEAIQRLHTLWPAASSEAELFANAADEALQLSLHLDADVTSIDRDAPARFRALCEALHAEVPQLQGGGLLVHAASDAKASRRVQERQRIEVARWGSPTLQYRVGELTYQVSRNAFFQVNRFLTEQMIEVAVGSRSCALALDLFAGAGLFSIALTRRFARVVAVEIGQPAASDLAIALSQSGPQHQAEHKTTLAFLREWNRKHQAPPDLVVMDPPRAGLGRDVVAELLKVGAAEMAYVSCDPTTFVRDCAALVESRYTLDEVHLLDLFPQTFHLETIAIFRRR